MPVSRLVLLLIVVIAAAALTVFAARLFAPDTGGKTALALPMLVALGAAALLLWLRRGGRGDDR